jgi:amidophosphoribosyltransferase
LRGDDDAELVLHLLAQSSQRTLVNRLLDALGSLRGGFSFALATAGMCLAGRDPRGFRPLWIGTGEGVCAVASDPGALDAMGATHLREVGVGELVILEPGAPPWTLRPWGAQHPAACAQEWIGLAPVDSVFEGVGVHTVRQRLGLALAATCPAPADLVACLPDACPVAAMAFAAQLALPMAVVFAPAGAANGRWAALPGAVRGRRVALVHEPGVPAARMRAAVLALRAAGARQVHLRCMAPWLTADCRHGVRLPAPWIDAASLARGDSIAGPTGTDSAEALSSSSLAAALGRGEDQHCEACLGGSEPLPEEEASATLQLPLFTAAGGGPNAQRGGMLDCLPPPGSRNQHG